MKNNYYKEKNHTAPSANSPTNLIPPPLNGEINLYRIPDNQASITLDGMIYLISKDVFDRLHSKYSKSMGKALKTYVRQQGIKPVKIY